MSVSLLMKAVRVYEHGGPEVLKFEDVASPQPSAGEVLVRNHVVGVNFTDVYSRSGAFPPPSLPFIPGKEAAGEVIAVGEGVVAFAPGDRVAYVETLGAYAERSVVPVQFLVKLPDSVDFETAAAMMLRGLTAQFLVRQVFRVAPGHTILVQAAAGGVGSILTQWAKHLGATVIGTVGSPEKAAVARKNGCEHVIDYHQENFAYRVKEITGGKGCDVVYDSVGKDTFPGSLDCLRPFGQLVSFGFASGVIPPFDIMLLLMKGSLFATWPGLTTYLTEGEGMLAMSKQLIDVVTSGAVKIGRPTCLPLSDAIEAHRRLESRRMTGSTVLFP